MELLFNELSLHGQFEELSSFRNAVARVLQVRHAARRYGRSLPCHRNLPDAMVTSTVGLRQAVQSLTLDERRVFLQWLTRDGPFWDEGRRHSGSDWYEHSGNIVTDTALGEAASYVLSNIDLRLVSVTPSTWAFAPIQVDRVTDSGAREPTEIWNYWDVGAIETALEAAPVPLQSWNILEAIARTRCDRLVFSNNAFRPLNGQPFSASAARRLLILLQTLDRFKSCFNANGERTAEGHEIYRNFFTGISGDGGHGAIFSDSSDRELAEFTSEMTFAHPHVEGQTILCSWHGKVQTPQLRIHFSYPVRNDTPLYVVYVGPKITKA